MIRPANLREDWIWVRGLIERVIVRLNEQYLPEDVYAAVKGGAAAMWVADDPQGVLVAYQDKAAWSGEPVLHVWICVCDDSEPLQDEAYKVLEDAARRIGAKRIVMESPRPGWQKRGWTVARYKYERQL